MQDHRGGAQAAPTPVAGVVVDLGSEVGQGGADLGAVEQSGLAHLGEVEEDGGLAAEGGGDPEVGAEGFEFGDAVLQGLRAADLAGEVVLGGTSPLEGVGEGLCEVGGGGGWEAVRVEGGDGRGTHA